MLTHEDVGTAYDPGAVGYELQGRRKLKLTVATVQTGNYLGRGAEYVAKLFAGVKRHMPADIELKFLCITDDRSTLPEGVEARGPWARRPASWWDKLSLFHPLTFEPGERVLYYDLDTLIVGDQGDLARYSGPFAILRDVYKPAHMQSSVMAWEAGTLDHIWTIWIGSGMPLNANSDQGWVEFVQGKADFWQDMWPGQIVSYKKDCEIFGGVPEDARTVVFHGHPRLHATGADWVDELWRA